MVDKYNLQSSEQRHEEGIFVLTSQRMQLRLREGKQLAWNHPAGAEKKRNSGEANLPHLPSARWQREGAPL
jgi:hypothetical protein